LKNKSPLIVAEIGVNHNGKFNQALKLIDEAKKCGVDAVKFQTYITDELVLKNAPLAVHQKKNIKKKISHYEILKKLELKFEDFIKLKKYCEKKKLIFISTPYDIKSLEFLINLKVKFIKFASSELLNYPMLDIARNSNIPLIISTGMSSFDEIKESIEFILKKNKNITVLKCTSNYPTLLDSINLKSLKSLQDYFKDKIKYGFSDHSIGSVAAISSLKYNVSMIEKHFTLNKKGIGPDHKASMNPREFMNFVIDIRNSKLAEGEKKWVINSEELKQRKTMRKGCYARYNLKKGDKLDIKDVIFLRPPNKLSPKDLYIYCLNKKIKSDIKKGTALKKENFI